MKNKKDRFQHTLHHTKDCYDELSDECTLLFLFGNKPAISIRYPIECEIEILKIIKINAEMILKKKLYLKVFKIKKDKRSILSKNRISIGINTDKRFGEELGIPICCIEKYVNEKNFNGNSNNSAKRYLKQMERLRIKKDKFEIFSGSMGGSSKFGFIPCNPKCKKALEIFERFNKIEKKLEK